MIYLGVSTNSTETILEYEMSVLFKVVFSAIPNSNDTMFLETVKLVECLSNFDDLVLFCFVALMKYYKPNEKSYKLKKKRENYTVLFKIPNSKHRWTFNSLIYFSGLFHSNHDNGTKISLPIQKN